MDKTIECNSSPGTPASDSQATQPMLDDGSYAPFEREVVHTNIWRAFTRVDFEGGIWNSSLTLAVSCQLDERTYFAAV